MIHLVNKKRNFIVAAALLAIIVPGAAYARNGTEDGRGPAMAQTETSTDSNISESGADRTTRDGVDRQTGRERAQVAREGAEERAAARTARLEGAQLKRCEKRETAIKNIMARMADRGERQIDLFENISIRVNDFHLEKGYTVENYGELMATVNEKRQNALGVVVDIRGADVEFDCEGENPKGVASIFKESLKEQNTALKEYRTAVKDLIVGVRSAQPDKTSDATETTEESEPTESTDSSSEGEQE